MRNRRNILSEASPLVAEHHGRRYASTEPETVNAIRSVDVVERDYRRVVADQFLTGDNLERQLPGDRFRPGLGQLVAVSEQAWTVEHCRGVKQGLRVPGILDAVTNKRERC